MSVLTTSFSVRSEGDRQFSKGDDANCRDKGVNKYLLVALSTADTNKWSTLIEGRLVEQTQEDHTTSDYRLLGPIRRRQRRLTEAQVVEMTARYKAGSTVYELAAEFSCHRTTVAARLKKAGIEMRLQSPTAKAIDSMALLYESAICMVEIVKNSRHQVLPTH